MFWVGYVFLPALTYTYLLRHWCFQLRLRVLGAGFVLVFQRGFVILLPFAFCPGEGEKLTGSLDWVVFWRPRECIFPPVLYIYKNTQNIRLSYWQNYKISLFFFYLSQAGWTEQKVPFSANHFSCKINSFFVFNVFSLSEQLFFVTLFHFVS